MFNVVADVSLHYETENPWFRIVEFLVTTGRLSSSSTCRCSTRRKTERILASISNMSSSSYSSEMFSVVANVCSMLCAFFKKPSMFDIFSDMKSMFSVVSDLWLMFIVVSNVGVAVRDEKPNYRWQAFRTFTCEYFELSLTSISNFVGDLLVLWRVLQGEKPITVVEVLGSKYDVQRRRRHVNALRDGKAELS